MMPLLLICLSSLGPSDSDELLTPKAALQELNDFIGEWKGSGGPEKRRPEPKETWQETIAWGWRFKGDDVWLNLTLAKGRHFKSGELRYLPERKLYQLTAVDTTDQKKVYEGTLKDGYLTLDRLDPSTRQTERLIMNSAGDGVRFIYRVSHRAQGRTIFVKDYQVAATKAGEQLAAKEKKVECPVSGGLGTMAVTYKGVTYYVCCSGCRDAFNENPEKYIREFEAKKKK